jgi:DNA-binding CsgD family transcriptional regulator
MVAGMGVAVVSPVFVGRRQELSVLASEVSRVAGGEPGFVLVGGEAGVGKTRLVEEAADVAGAAGFRVLTGRCVELGPEGLPLAALVEALRALARSAPAEELERWLGPARGALARLLPSLDPTIELAASGSGQAPQLPELVLGVVERVSTAQPLLLVFEDLHWADQSTLELLAHLVRGLQEVPVLILVTYRSDEIHRRHPLRPLLTGWERMRTVRWLELARFDRDEVAAQVTAILDRPVQDDLVEVVLDRSEGNAYLVEEIVGMLNDDRVPGALSPSLRDVLLVRVEPRSAEAQRVLRAASVSGRQVPERLLAAVVGTEVPLLSALRELVDNHLLVVDETGQGYAFRHKLARDAVYDDMLPGERIGWHAAYGRALAASPQLAADDTAVPATLALHWFTALDLPSALPAFLAAAAASSTYAPAEELRHLERVLEIWPRVTDAATLTGTDAIEVLHSAADAALRAGSVERALSLLDQALADVGEAGPAVRRALLLECRSRALRDLGHDAQGLAFLRQAQDLLPAAPLTSAHAVVLTSLANSVLNLGDMPAAQATAEQAVIVAVAVDAQAQEAEARITLASAQAYLGDTDSGLSGLLAGIRLAEQIGAIGTALRGYVNYSDALELVSRHQEAIDAATAGTELAQRIGSGRRLGPYLTGNLVESLVRMGRWEEAEHAAVEASRNQPVGVFAAALLDIRALLAVLAGRRQDAERLAAQAKLLAASNASQYQQSLAFTLAEASRLAGDLDGAAAIIAEVLPDDFDTSFVRYSWPLIWLGTRIAADQAVLARDRRTPQPEDDQAGRLAAIAQALPTRTPQARGYAATTLAERNRLTATVTVDTWQAAVQCWRAADEPYPLAYCLLRLAEDLCTLNARPRATTALQEAAQLAARLGAAPLTQEAEALARRARLPLTDDPGKPAADAMQPATAPPADALARFGLTEREREVLQLLADGRSNAQIAKTLYISPKTASVHVSNILAKLAVTGRVEAAALVHRLTTRTAE